RRSRPRRASGRAFDERSRRTEPVPREGGPRSNPRSRAADRPRRSSAIPRASLGGSPREWGRLATAPLATLPGQEVGRLLEVGDRPGAREEHGDLELVDEKLELFERLCEVGGRGPQHPTCDPGGSGPQRDRTGYVRPERTPPLATTGRPSGTSSRTETGEGIPQSQKVLPTRASRSAPCSTAR